MAREKLVIIYLNMLLCGHKYTVCQDCMMYLYSMKQVKSKKNILKMSENK